MLTQKCTRFTQSSLWHVRTTTITCRSKEKRMLSIELVDAKDEGVMTHIGLESVAKMLICLKKKADLRTIAKRSRRKTNSQVEQMAKAVEKVERCCWSLNKNKEKREREEGWKNHHSSVAQVQRIGSVLIKALLAKQMWCLVQRPNMLVAQVFKKKYYPRGNFEFSFGTYIFHSMHGVYGEAYGEQRVSQRQGLCTGAWGTGLASEFERANGYYKSPVTELGYRSCWGEINIK